MKLWYEVIIIDWLMFVCLMLLFIVIYIADVIWIKSVLKVFFYCCCWVLRACQACHFYFIPHAGKYAACEFNLLFLTHINYLLVPALEIEMQSSSRLHLWTCKRAVSAHHSLLFKAHRRLKRFHITGNSSLFLRFQKSHKTHRVLWILNNLK